MSRLWNMLNNAGAANKNRCILLPICLDKTRFTRESQAAIFSRCYGDKTEGAGGRCVWALELLQWSDGIRWTRASELNYTSRLNDFRYTRYKCNASRLQNHVFSFHLYQKLYLVWVSDWVSHTCAWTPVTEILSWKQISIISWNFFYLVSNSLVR